MLTDPVADMLTRIRNANKALHDRTEMPSSKLKEQIARILKEEGYVRDYRVEEKEGLPYKVLVVELKYGRGRERVLTGLKRISKPGRRVYAGKDRLPRVLKVLDDYVTMGVPNLWILDPIERVAYLYKDGALRLIPDRLTIPNTEIYVDLPTLFAELD